MAFVFHRLDIPDVILICSDKYTDNRGFFTEGFREDAFEGLPHFVQDNISQSCRGTLRGLHYQLAPRAQAKLVTCLKGYIVDVAVDIRKDSPTFGHYVKVELFGPGSMLYVPVGFAHGFLALEDDTLISYKCSNYYSPEHDRNIIWNDPQINIDWGLDEFSLLDGDVHVSEKDSLAPLLKNADL